MLLSPFCSWQDHIANKQDSAQAYKPSVHTLLHTHKAAFGSKIRWKPGNSLDTGMISFRSLENVNQWCYYKELPISTWVVYTTHKNCLNKNST